MSPRLIKTVILTRVPLVLLECIRLVHTDDLLAVRIVRGDAQPLVQELLQRVWVLHVANTLRIFIFRSYKIGKYSYGVESIYIIFEPTVMEVTTGFKGSDETQNALSTYSISSQSQVQPRQRKVQLFSENHRLSDNTIRTSKYRWFDFLPKNFLEQFSKLPNIYFVTIGILQAIPFTSNSDGVPTIFIPLGVIIFATAVKDLYEDYHRSISDETENNQVVTQLSPAGDRQIQSRQIRVGMCIKIKRDENLPCDGFLLYSPNEFAYVETKSLDGETNLKRKNVHPKIKDRFFYSGKHAESGELSFSCEPPNANLLSFSAVVNSFESVNINQFLFRSSKLRNTEQIVMLAAYTGHDTKILLNMNKPNQKKTSLTSKLGYTILGIFVAVIVISMIISVVEWRKERLTVVPPLLKIWTSWILNLTNLVPISLIVTLEIVKLLQGKLLEKDPKLVSNGIQPIVNASNVLQDLGSIEYVATDKTGTLTQNNLIFREITDGHNILTENSPMSLSLLKPLGICHEVFVSSNKQIEGVSQDQICIMEFCRFQGFQMLNRTPTSLTYTYEGLIKEVQIMKIIEFSSTRKRQSMIVRQSNEIRLYCKGADDVMIERITPSSHQVAVYHDIEELAHRGRRTLVYASKKLNPEAAIQWIKVHNIYTLSNDQEELNRMEDKMEMEMDVICGTGIEDQLQDQVGETLKDLVDAGIKIVIISGDKPETVMSIASNLGISFSPILATTKTYMTEYSTHPLVVFARCTPKEKSKIVAGINGRVLAIGDGANDVAMLTQANIGVGIKGKQGMAASQAADIGVSQFRHLRRLIFYYGVEISRKNSVLIKYNFYKNFLFTLPQLIFGYYSMFSGVYLYDPYISQVFNLLYTSVPIMVFALFDRDSTDSRLMHNENNIYKETQIADSFNFYSFVLTLIEAFVQSMIGCYCCFTLMSGVFVSPHDLSLFETSTILVLYIVLLSNQKMLILSKYLSTGFITSVVIGIVAFFATLALFITLSRNMGPFEKFINGQTLLLAMLCYVNALVIHYLVEMCYWGVIGLRKKLASGSVEKRLQEVTTDLVASGEEAPTK